MREILDELTDVVGDGVRQSGWPPSLTRRGLPRAIRARPWSSGPEGTVHGSVSGGCVEGAVYELAQEVMADGAPVLEHYGFSDTDAFAVGLTCGGELDVFVERVNRATFPELSSVADDIRSGRYVALATLVDHPDPAWRGRHLACSTQRESGAATTGTLGSDRADAAVSDDALGLLAAGHHGLLSYGPDGQRLGEGMRVFVQSFAPPPRMLVFGAIDFASAVAAAGSFLGYQVTVCDARAVFATTARFPRRRRGGGRLATSIPR